MWTRTRPFPGMNDMAIFLQVHQGNRPERPSPAQCHDEVLLDALWELIQRCWAQDPNARPTIGEVEAYFDPPRPSRPLRLRDLLN